VWTLLTYLNQLYSLTIISHKSVPAYVAVLAAALQYDKDLEWAIRRSRELGFEIHEGKNAELYRAYVYWLVTKRTRDEL
jgi:hypothetical protein